MKVLIIYYSQSGNTLLIARHIEKGLRKAGAGKVRSSVIAGRCG